MYGGSGGRAPFILNSEIKDDEFHSLAALPPGKE
jgi:hypothetical protein